MAQSQIQFGYRRHPDQDRAGADIGRIMPSWWSAPDRSGCRSRSTWRSAASRWCCSTTPTGSARARARSAFPSARWNTGTGSASASAWSTRAWSGTSARSSTATRSCIQFNLLPEDGHKRPAFINLQQFYAEAYLVDRVARASRDRPALAQQGDRRSSSATIMSCSTIDTPDGPYRLRASYVIACDGARSSLRQMVGADFEGQVFEDQFLIADVKMTAEFPTERWFWFDPPFHAGRSALLHRQPDDIWRIDLQLDPDADPAVEKRPENVRPRIARMLGHDNFDFEWISLYKFQCRRMENFIHGRVIFAGDAAHQVSPFGARGANSGLEDAENLAWKLDRVLRRQLAGNPARELSTLERSAAADENIREFDPLDRFHGAGLAARRRGCARPCCRWPGDRIRQAHGQWRPASVPSIYDSPLSTADQDTWRGGAAAGRLDAGCADRDAATATPMFLTDAFIGGNAVHAAGFRQRRGGRRARGRRRDPHRRQRRLCRSRGPGRRALRCRARHGLSAAARRLCRRALPPSDPRSARRRAGARLGPTEVIDHGTVDQLEFRQAR